MPRDAYAYAAGRKYRAEDISWVKGALFSNLHSLLTSPLECKFQHHMHKSFDPINNYPPLYVKHNHKRHTSAYAEESRKQLLISYKLASYKGELCIACTALGVKCNFPAWVLLGTRSNVTPAGGKPSSSLFHASLSLQGQVFRGDCCPL